ncbi:hypothetical protein BJX65DRAFT_311747 [Aspergillus insuetus]
MGSVLGFQSLNSPSPACTTACTTLHTPEVRESVPDSSEAATRTVLHLPELLQNSLGPGGAPERRALNTPEILEMILLEMDMRTLLTSGQRVCHTWTNLIRTSRSIQRALFFIPTKESEWATAEKIPNPLLAEVFPSIFPASDEDDDDRFAYSSLPMAKDTETMNRFVQPNASWRRMLVQQPPLKNIGLFHVRSSRGGDSIKRSTIPADPKSSPGLQMERLFELLLFSDGGRSGRRIPRRVYWSTEEPIPFEGRTRRMTGKFHRLVSECGVVVFSYEIRRCGKGLGRCPPRGPDEHMRRKILCVYDEKHLSDEDPGEPDHDSPWWDYDSGPYDAESDESDWDTYSIEEV